MRTRIEGLTEAAALRRTIQMTLGAIADDHVVSVRSAADECSRLLDRLVTVWEEIEDATWAEAISVGKELRLMKAEMKRHVMSKSDSVIHRRMIVERILASWERVPSLRLGQLLSNALMEHAKGDGSPLFYMSDEELAKAVSDYSERHGR